MISAWFILIVAFGIFTAIIIDKYITCDCCNNSNDDIYYHII